MAKFPRFPRTFWVANTMELFERWAYYGLFAVLAVYLTDPRDSGALGFTDEQQGLMMGVFGLIVYFLPVFTGAIADKFGYKKMLLIAYSILITGYFCLGMINAYATLFFGLVYTAIGAALFKPLISATIAKTTNEKNASIGFGIFYTIVNIGAFIGPFVASKAREHNWKYVFVISSLVIVVNLVLLLFYKEPYREKNEEGLGESIRKIVRNIITVMSDFKFLLFIILIIGFWTMWWQLFFTLPKFIRDWIDTRIIYDAISNFSPWLAGQIGTSEGIINPEMLLNIDALYIVFFQILISALVMKFKPLKTMISGIFVCSVGAGLWYITQNGLFLFVTIFVFAIGEMSSSPKITEYIGRIAPKDKVALYMGMSFLPLAFGNFIGGTLSGSVYSKMANKINLLKEEVALRGLEIPKISKSFTENDYWNQAKELMGLSDQGLTDYLWNTYHPSRLWIVYTSIGLFTALGLYLYDRFILKD